MGHDEGADRALSALLDLCSAVRGGALDEARRLAGPSSPLDGETVAHGFGGQGHGGRRLSDASDGGASADSRARRRVDASLLSPAALATIEAQALYMAADDLGPGVPEGTRERVRAAAAAMVFEGGDGGEPCAVAELRQLARAAAMDDTFQPESGCAADASGDDATAAALAATDASATRGLVHGRAHMCGAASPAGTGTSDGTGDGAGTSASYSQLRLQFDLMQAEHREQLREMRRSLRKALRRIEGLKTARSAAITAPARPAGHGGAGLGSDPEAVSPPASIHAATQAAAGGRGDRREQQVVPTSPPSRRGSAGGVAVAMTSPAGSRRRLDGHAPATGLRSKRKSAVQAVGERQDALAGDVADIRAEVARMRQAMARETREKDELSRRLARTAKAATTREKRLTRALKAVASKLPGGSKEFQSLLRGLSSPGDSSTS